MINGCSSLLEQVFGPEGVGARSAVGMASLPFDTTVEIEIIFEIAPGKLKVFMCVCVCVCVCVFCANGTTVSIGILFEVIFAKIRIKIENRF